jgi:cyclopropane fatty-acyl-phospholipid synthase-like methyltransferase
MEKDNDWFKTWFNSNYYHMLYRNRSQSEANQFINNLIIKLQLDKDSKALDLGCGKGRHAYKMSQHFKQVDGLDLSKESISIAQKFSKSNLNFYVGDMRKFNLSNNYNYIFNLFTSFGYFENMNQNIDVLKCCHAHLEKNGFLLIDFLNPRLLKNKIIKQETKKIDGVVFEINKLIKDNHVIKNIKITDRGTIHQYEEKVQLFEKKLFIEMFNKSGFKLISSYGNYHLDSFEDESERLILWAKKI